MRKILFILLILIPLIRPSFAWGPYTHAEIAKYMTDSMGLSPRDSKLSESFFFVFGSVMADMDYGIIPKDFTLEKSFLGGKLKLSIPIDFPGDEAPFDPGKTSTVMDVNGNGNTIKNDDGSNKIIQITSDNIYFARNLIQGTSTYLQKHKSLDPLISKAITSFVWGWYAHVFMDEVCNHKLSVQQNEERFLNIIGNWDKSIDDFGTDFTKPFSDNKGLETSALTAL